MMWRYWGAIPERQLGAVSVPLEGRSLSERKIPGLCTKNRRELISPMGLVKRFLGGCARAPSSVESGERR